MIVAFTTCAGIGTYFVYQNWSLVKNVSRIQFNTRTQTIFSKLINGKSQQIDIKNRTYYFYNDQIKLKDFDAGLLKVDKKDQSKIDIYYIGYVTIKKIANCNNINSVKLLYLMINEMNGHFEEKSGNKDLVLDDVGENKEVSKKYE